MKPGDVRSVGSARSELYLTLPHKHVEIFVPSVLLENDVLLRICSVSYAVSDVLSDSVGRTVLPKDILDPGSGRGLEMGVGLHVVHQKFSI